MKLSRHVGRIMVMDGHCFIEWSYPKERKKSLSDMPEGTWITETIKPVGKSISHKQLGYYYAVILPTVHEQLLEDGIEVMGVPISQETADEILKHHCSDGLKKRNMSVDDAKEFIDRCIQWANITLGCRIPEPDERDK